MTIMTSDLTFAALRAANVNRCLKWHTKGLNSWSVNEWLTATIGEVGELASLIKMRLRERDGFVGNKFSPTQKMIADELADVVIYLDLVFAAIAPDFVSSTSFSEFRAANIDFVPVFKKGDPSDLVVKLVVSLGRLVEVKTEVQVATQWYNTLVWLDYLAFSLDIDLGQAVRSKFNEVSIRVGFDDLL